MSRLASIPARVIHQPWTKVIVDALQADTNYLIIAGADLASAATIHPTAEFHGITGATQIDNITDDLGAIAGQQVRLWIKAGPLTIRNNGGGAGNIRTLRGVDRQCATNEILTFVYDGALWREQGPGLGRGVSTVTWPGGTPTATTLVVNHGLGVTPFAVVGNPHGTSGLGGNVPAVQTLTYTATQFSIQAQTTDGTSPVNGSTVDVAWIASP